VDSKGDKLNGNVKKMEEYEYGFGYRNRKPILAQTAIYTYDKELKQEHVYHYQGTDSPRYIYRDIFKFSGNKLIEHRYVLKGGAHGGYRNDGDSICSITTNKYNDNDRLIEISASQGRNNSKTNYIYDEQGNVIENDVYYNVDPPYIAKNIFKYDSGGHVLQKDYYNDRVAYHTLCKYRNNYHYSKEQTIDTISNSEWKTTIRRYDDRMNLIEESTYCRCDDTHTKNKYKYDDKGNWVDRTNYMHGKKYSYIKRVITY